MNSGKVDQMVSLFDASILACSEAFSFQLNATQERCNGAIESYFGYSLHKLFQKDYQHNLVSAILYKILPTWSLRAATSCLAYPSWAISAALVL